MLTPNPFTSKPFTLQKKTLSLYIRNGCDRQCRLSLYSEPQRRQNQMPPKQDARSGLGAVGKAGYDYQDKIVGQMQTIFGDEQVICGPTLPGKNRPETIALSDHIGSLQAHQFLVEAKFTPPLLFLQRLKIDDLRDENGLLLEFSDLNPDIIAVSPSRLADLADKKRACEHAVEADGKLTRLEENDARLQLRIIDVKLASDPGAHYFAEVVYYSMALAAWIEEQGLQRQFVVAANGAVWPGTYEHTALWQQYTEGVRSGLPASTTALIEAMEADLEKAEFAVYGPRVLRFLQQDLRRIISTPWQELAWHVNFRCGGCDFLGYDWNIPGKPPHPLQCWPTAITTDHLSRIYGLSKGAATSLRAAAATVKGVALLTDDHEIFARHPNLRARKNVLLARARSLAHNTAGGIAGSGASAVIPTYADLKIFVTLDYDPSSAITAALSLRASWREPRPFGSDRERDEKRWGDKANGNLVYLVDQQNLDAEKREFLRFLKTIKSIMADVRQLDETRLATGAEQAAQTGGNNQEKPSTYQIYLWDGAQFRHLTRLISRYLIDIINDSDLRDLAWLFPPDELLPDPDHATRHSPLSLVSEVVENHLAVPVPHYYSLHDVAQTYLSPNPPPQVLDLYRDPLTNLIPPERIHEMWSHDHDWQTTQNRIAETSAKKTLALALLTDKLTHDPNIQLSKSIAPVLGAVVENRVLKAHKATPEGLLWHEFTRLCAAVAEVETQMYYALPPSEREARFRAAHLLQRLSGNEEVEALATINRSCSATLVLAPDLLIYTLSEYSVDVKIKSGDFTWALSPREENLFLNLNKQSRLPNAQQYCKSHLLYKSIGDGGLTGVSLEAIDRQNLLVALRLSKHNRIRDMERLGDADFRKNVMLDETAMDVLSDKVKASLEAIGQPLTEPQGPDISAILRHANIRPQKKNRKHVEAHDFLYSPAALATTPVSRSTGLKDALLAQGVKLNASQWDAWEMALSRRLTVIWGPPGTGKSQTLRAIVRGAVLDAQKAEKPLRLFVTANNYNAVDNVLLELEKQFRQEHIAAKIYRVESKTRGEDDRFASEYPSLINIQLDKSDPDEATLELLQTLDTPAQQIVIVGTIPHQIHNLAFVNSSGVAAPVKEWFDFVVLDEASQMDVASSTLVWSKIAAEGACVLAGDDLQLPPIQQAEPPQDLDDLVGSVYSFMKKYHELQPCALEINYRSNHSIVNFIIEAGYDETLAAHSPALELNLAAAIPVTEPSDWPAVVPFSPNWARLLDPEKPLTCFVYDDVVSGQSNEFEAQVVAALSALLHERMGAPLNRCDAEGNLLKLQIEPYSTAEFWQKGVGVVAPHRAQGSRINDLLQKVFRADTAATPALIAGAVDTVERYQGQQRDVIIASFGLGDPEMIAVEDEFLYDLRRFNVMVSRACVKVIVLMSRSVLEHLSDDQDVLRASRLLKQFVELYCADETALQLPFYNGDGQIELRAGIMKTAS